MKIEISEDQEKFLRRLLTQEAKQRLQQIANSQDQLWLEQDLKFYLKELRWSNGILEQINGQRNMMP